MEFAVTARKALTQTGGFDLKLNRELAAVEAEFKAKSLPLDSLRSFLQKMKDKPDYEMSFDIIGPSGSLFIVQAEADGKMKVENQLRKYFNKIGGFRLANDGVKNWFRETGVVVVCPEKDGEKVAFEKMEEYAIELDCENVLSIEDDEGVKYELQCEIKNLSKVEKQLQNDGFKVESAEIEYRPLHPVVLQGDDSVQVEKLYEMFQVGKNSARTSCLNFWKMGGERDIDRTIFTPRDYQIELLDKATNKNIVVQLGTGAGKTFIAVLLLKEYALQLLPDIDKGGKRAFFIVDKVVLVKQQAEHVQCHTTLTVGQIHGGLNCEVTNDADKFHQFIKDYQVIVMTAQILLDLVNHALFDLRKAALLIFDECHHALGHNHPYRAIMRNYISLPQDDRPRILGLTASIISDKTLPNDLEDKINKLEKILDCSVETTSNLVALSKYGARPYEAVVICENFQTDSITDIEESLKILMCLTWERFLLKIAQQETRNEKTITFIRLVLTSLVHVRKTIELKMKSIRSIDSLHEIAPHKVKRLLEILKAFNPDVQKEKGKNEPLCGIVFVNQRYVAYVLNLLLRAVKTWDPMFKFLSPDYVIGFSGSSLASEDSQGLHKRQEEVLRKFRKRELNLLIATSVLEEGVDVQQCNLVVKFDQPKDYRSYVQSKGRARKPGAIYAILTEINDSANLNNDLQDFRSIEQILLKRSLTVGNPMEDTDLVPETVESIIPEYVTAKGAKVSMLTAIPLVNRYCAKLPSDVFTRLTPQISIISNDGRTFWAELTLPINSPQKMPVKLQSPMNSKKLAQMAVALEACKVLHQKKELNDNLLPVGRENVAKYMQHLDDDPDEYIPGYRHKVGSSKRKLLYDKKLPTIMTQAVPKPHEPCFLYVMHLERIKEPTAESNPKKRKFLNPTQYEYYFGFLSANKLPKIPAFPVYLRQGEMRICLHLAEKKVDLSQQLLTNIKHFHHYIFDDVLQLCKTALIFRTERRPDDDTTPFTNTLLVPLNRTVDEKGNCEYEINMLYIEGVIKRKLIDQPRQPTDEERKLFKFDPSRYRDAVVTPWYRNLEHPVYYYVAEITERTPASPFSDPKYASFNDYFKAKYSIEIFDQEQKLLDVDHTSNRLNLLLPRTGRNRRVQPQPAAEKEKSVEASEDKENSAITTSASMHSLNSDVEVTPVAKASSKSDEKKRAREGQLFVPELLDVHPISATLWNLIAALPSFFYRVNHLLLADEVRKRIIIEALSVPEEKAVLSDETEWSPLFYPATYEEKESLIVKKIQQLREMNKNTEKKIEPVERVEGDFNIGVWDPEMGAPFAPEKRPDFIEIGDDDAIGLVPSASITTGDLSDEEDDFEDAPFELFDVSKYLSDKRTTRDAFAAPRENIVASGWGDPDDEQPQQPFELITSNTENSLGIDMKALNADLQSHFLITPTPLADGNEASTSKAQTTNQKVTPARNANANRAAIDEKMLAKKFKEFELNDDDDERDTGVLRQREETVNLAEFDDEQELVNEQGKNGEVPMETDEVSEDTWTKEYKKMMKGEKDKEMKDRLATTDFRLPKGEVLAAPLTNARFKFASSSQTAVSLLAQRGETASTSAALADVRHDPSLLLENPYGVSPALILIALTASNAADGINLERMETIGDSFLKYAVTDYLYHEHWDQHEGNLSFARSKEVSNCNLFRLGKKLGLGNYIVASKFDVQDSWLPPCYVPKVDFKAPNADDVEENEKFMDEVLDGNAEASQKVKMPTGWDAADAPDEMRNFADGVETINFPKPTPSSAANEEISPLPYNMLTQQYISDKTIADCVEALIGAHLLTLGPKPTLKVMKWMGLKVDSEKRTQEPLLRFIADPEQHLKDMYIKFNFQSLEDTIGYRFNDKAYLVQAFTHASYYKNRITGCYQRLEFLGDAVLDYMITRYLYEDARQYSPGVLTDLRSALVNNTIFASLAVKYNFHKHFIAMCPGLHHMIEKFVKLCKERNFLEANFNAEMYMVTTEEEIDEGQEEDIEVPKAMSDVFESIAGAIYLDSNRDLDVVWRVVYHLMRDTIEECCANPPRSPIRELMELEQGRARFSKMERIIERGKVRVTVEVGGKMKFTGMGRNYRIAKTTAAKRALRQDIFIRKFYLFI
ncbi:hypothetical protein WR25_10602 [Diploscapter pachys]|uniref:Uncharacterized protein n=1 Tax=Diploscapter pachys TaxID=2018661 RepID=A0A2A2JFQ0_9BILA|nr:hypothetical protein WR25_10602 [Diploscapter pachys]